MSKIKLPTLKESRVTALEKQRKYYNLVGKHMTDSNSQNEAISKASFEITEQEITRLQANSVRIELKRLFLK